MADQNTGESFGTPTPLGPQVLFAHYEHAVQAELLHTSGIGNNGVALAYISNAMTEFDKLGADPLNGVYKLSTLPNGDLLVEAEAAVPET